LPFQAKFDRTLSKDLYIQFDIQPTTGSSFNEVAIKQYIKDNLEYNINEVAETSKITCISRDAINDNGGGGVPINVEISNDGILWFDFLSVDIKNEKWILDISRINITIL